MTLPSLRPASVQCGACFLFCPLGCDTAWEPLSPGTKPRTDKVTTWKSKPGAQPQSGPCKARKHPSPASSLVQLCSGAAPSGCSSHSARLRPLVWSTRKHAELSLIPKEREETDTSVQTLRNESLASSWFFWSPCSLSSALTVVFESLLASFLGLPWWLRG